MERIYSEADVTWSSIEKYYDYDEVIWSIDKNGIPKYMLMDEDFKKIEVNFDEVL